MTYRTHQTNKKNGVTYVYDVVSVWHKELGQARDKQICVGKLDPITCELIPSNRFGPQQAANHGATGYSQSLEHPTPWQCLVIISLGN